MKSFVPCLVAMLLEPLALASGTRISPSPRSPPPHRAKGGGPVPGALAPQAARNPRPMERGAGSARRTPPSVPSLGDGHAWVFHSAFREGKRVHVRWDHVYRGLPVLGSQMITHEEGHRVLPPTPSLALLMGPGGLPMAPPVPSSLEPEVSREGASRIIILHGGPLARPAGVAKADLVLIPVMEQVDLAMPGETNAAGFPFLPSRYVLAWRLETAPPRASEFILDARSGAILRKCSLDRRAGRGRTLFNGEVDLDTTPREGGFELRDPHRGTGGNTVVPWKGGDGSGQEDEPPYRVAGLDRWGTGDPGDELTLAASAAFALQSAWDYFRCVHGRNGWDGRGTATRIILGDEDEDAGAAWKVQENWIAVGPGDESWLPSLDLATIGHEFSHGVTASTAKLNEGPESRGLDEGSCDFFGQMIDSWARGRQAYGMPWASGHIPDAGTMWRMVQPARGSRKDEVVRCLSDPALLPGHPEAWTPELYLEDEHDVGEPLGRALYFLSRGAAPGTHHASSPNLEPPHASKLLPSGMPGIGNDRTAALWYQALTQELQPHSDYRDARRAMMKVARDPREAALVARAFAAIGVGHPGRVRYDLETWSAGLSAQARTEGGDVVFSVRGLAPGKVRCLTFLVDDVPLGTCVEPPFELRVAGGGRFDHGWRTLRAVVRDREDQVAHTPLAAFEWRGRTRQLIPNPGFENPALGWTMDHPRIIRRVGEAEAHGGIRCAVLAPPKEGPGPSIATIVSLPPQPERLRLSFWTRTMAGAAPGADEGLTVSILSRPEGSVLQETRIPAAPGPGPFSGPGGSFLEETKLPAAEGPGRWVFHEMDLRAFAGRKVRILFRAGFKPGSATRFLLDDVLLAATDPEPK